MSDRIEQAFSNLRRGPWHTDPLGVPQQGFVPTGGIESQGWLSDGSVTADVIQANAVIAGKIDADAVTAREIAAATITANEIAASSITGANIAADTITGANIAANAITASEIAANTITANEIAANTITAAEIAADSITTSELAANAVIAENITAGEVTSGKIVLTLTGKNYGANSGGSAGTGIFFDVDNNAKIAYGSSKVQFASSVGTQLQYGAGSGVELLDTLKPSADNFFSLGASGRRWTAVWAANGTIQTSDRREKRDIQDAALGLDFVRSLRPRTFRWIDTPDTQADEAATVDEAAMNRATAPLERKIENIRAEQVAGRIGDDEADERVRVIRERLDTLRGQFAHPAHEARNKRRPGKRLHYGLIAQEVKESLDRAGVDSMDAAFWVQDPSGNQALVYSELIPVLIAAIKEQADRNDALEAQVADLVKKVTK